MKKIGLKLKKTAVSLAFMTAIALMAGMTGRLLVLAVTTEAMSVDWDDWIRNRNYEDSWTLAEHVERDLGSVLQYIGLKQLLEEEDGTLNLNRPALVTKEADGSRKTYSMQDLISLGEDYGIYIYRSADGSYYRQTGNSHVEDTSVKVLWWILNEEDTFAGLEANAWEVREERIAQILSEEENTETDAFLIPADNTLTGLSTDALLAVSRQTLQADTAGLTDAQVLSWETSLSEIREAYSYDSYGEEGSSYGGEAYEEEPSADAQETYLGTVQTEQPEGSGQEEADGEPEVSLETLPESWEPLPGEVELREEILRELERERENQLILMGVWDRYDLVQAFLQNCLQWYYELQYRLEETDSNLFYQIILEKNGKRRIYRDPDAAAREALSKEDLNAYFYYDSASQELEHTMSGGIWDVPQALLKNNTHVDYDRAVILVGLNTGQMVYEDSYWVEATSYANYRGQVFGAVGIFVGSTVAALFCLIWLMFLSGHKEGVDGIWLNSYDRIPTELGACGVLFMMMGLVSSVWLIDMVLTAYRSYQKEGLSMLLLSGSIGLSVLILYLVLWLGFYGLIRRMKAHTIWKNSLTAHFLAWCMKPVRWCAGQMKRVWNLLLNAGDTTWKTLSVFCVYFIVNFVWGSSMRYASAMSLLLYLAFNGAVGVFLVWRSSQMKQIHAGVKKIADGSLDYHLPLENLSGEARRLAMQINRISGGLKNAIEASVKNERMKTDLITNVSHDIKTPLTSIINYVDLLKREKIEDPRIQGYIDVLDKKSQRLKTLTEDLVEASKASSGTLKLNLEKIDFVELINQTCGEFTDRFEARNLTVVPSIPESSACIMADGRYVWRILENLYRNAEKYAMPGTRIYIDVFEKFGRIFFVMKNVSQAPLNIKAEELTERFIRGDVSRSTEGSGLGLSIAKDMTELMNGTFKIYLDGDLFRVTISFAILAEKKPDLKEMEESIRRRMAQEEEKAAGKTPAQPDGISLAFAAEGRDGDLFGEKGRSDREGSLWKGILPEEEPEKAKRGKLSFDGGFLRRFRRRKDRGNS